MKQARTAFRSVTANDYDFLKQNYFQLVPGGFSGLQEQVENTAKNL